MLKCLGSIALVAAFALAPLAGRAETASGAAGAHSMSHHHAHKPARSYRSEMRHRGNRSKEHARAGAEQVRQMRSQ